MDLYVLTDGRTTFTSKGLMAIINFLTEEKAIEISLQE